MPGKATSRSSAAHRSPGSVKIGSVKMGPAKSTHRPSRSSSIKTVKKIAAKPPVKQHAKAKPAGKAQAVSLKMKHPAVAKVVPKGQVVHKVKPEAAQPVKAPIPAAVAAPQPVAPRPPRAPAAPAPAAQAPVTQAPIAQAPAAQTPAAEPARPAAVDVTIVSATAVSAPAPVPAAETPAPPAVTVTTVVAPRVTAQPGPAADLRRVPAAPAPRGFATGGIRPGSAGGMAPGRPMVGPPPRLPAPAENFLEGDHVVYPTHGVGKIERIVTESIAGYRLELIHITFEENRMTLRVPVEKARSAGLRKLASRQLFDAALTTLRGRARIKRTMWSRRAQEYEAKINSGDPLAIAEVVRDLHRNAGQPDQSFSERQIYEAAMDRLAAELAALDNTDKATAAEKLTAFMKASLERDRAASAGSASE